MIRRWFKKSITGKIASTVSIVLLLCYAYSRNNVGRKAEIKGVVDAYYSVYMERTNFESFLSFYDDQALLEDIVSGERIVGKKNLTNFFNWDHKGLKKNERNSLVIYDQVIDENKVVTRGYFTPFLWKESKFDAMHFVTLLYFNDSGKISKQIDWINYPNNLLDYSSRKNANKWIKHP